MLWNWRVFLGDLIVIVGAQFVPFPKGWRFGWYRKGEG